MRETLNLTPSSQECIIASLALGYSADVSCGNPEQQSSWEAYLHGAKDLISQCALHVLLESLVEKDTPAESAYADERISGTTHLDTPLLGGGERTCAGHNLVDT